MYKRASADSCVVEACALKFCSAVQVFAALSVAPVTVVLVARHAPENATHPEVTLMPPENVEVPRSPKIVVVAVLPIYKRFSAESCVVDACPLSSVSPLKVCVALHTFTCARLSELTTAPVVGEMVSVPSLFDTEE